jgi:hypothetical protein
MLDLLRATSLLYGDCTQEPNSSDIYISTGKVTAEQMIAITAKATELQAAYDAKAYARNRVAAYPSIADQLDTIYHEGLDAWKATILAVKEEFPK